MNDEDAISISALPDILDACGIHWRNPKEEHKKLEKLMKEHDLGSTINYNISPIDIKEHR